MKVIFNKIPEEVAPLAGARIRYTASVDLTAYAVQGIEGSNWSTTVDIIDNGNNTYDIYTTNLAVYCLGFVANNVPGITKIEIIDGRNLTLLRNNFPAVYTMQTGVEKVVWKTNLALNLVDGEDLFWEFDNALGILDTSEFDVTRFWTMKGMFRYSTYTTIDISTWKALNVVNTSLMFYHCSANVINIAGFTLPILETAEAMFQVTSLDSFNSADLDISSAWNLRKLFYGMTVPSGYFDAKDLALNSATDITSLFASSNVGELDVSEWNMTSVVIYDTAFSMLSMPCTLDVSAWDTSSATSMGGMFSNNSGTTVLDVSNFYMNNVTSIGYMFYNSTIVNLDTTSWNTSNVHNMSHSFASSSLETVDVSNFDTNKVTNFSSMFHGSYKISIIDVSNFDTSNATTMDFMFFFTRALVLDVSNFNTEKVTNMEIMFASTFVSHLDTNSFVLQNNVNIARMFDTTRLQCLTGLNTLNAASDKNLLFNNNIYLNYPTTTDITDLMSTNGADWVNPNACP